MVETDSLILTLFTPQHLLALIEAPETFAGLTGYDAAQGLREFYTSGELSAEWLAHLRSMTEPNPWHNGFAVVHRDDQLIVGTAAYKGPPDTSGTVEIAYAIAPSYEGRGLATEAARALVEYAFADIAVTLVRAHTLPTANASTNVLKKSGFAFIGEVTDPEDGQVWRWELNRP